MIYRSQVDPNRSQGGKMAHVRQDTLVTPGEWWKHLKWMKRVVSKAERKASIKEIEQERIELQNEEDV